MKAFVLLSIVLFLFIVDISVMPNFRLMNYYPSILILFFYVYCFENNKYEIICLSIFVGFMQEVFFHNIFGINIFLNLCIGLILFNLANKYSSRNYILCIFFLLTASFIRNLFIRIYMFLIFGISIGALNLFYEFIYTLLLLLFVYPIFNILFRSRLFKKTLEF